MLTVVHHVDKANRSSASLSNAVVREAPTMLEGTAGRSPNLEQSSLLLGNDPASDLVRRRLRCQRTSSPDRG
jgi:hypothetical protein